MEKELPYHPELVCPAGTPAALRAAVDAGADTVYCGFRNETNARNFPGLNFNDAELASGIRYAHDGGAGLFVAINTYPQAGKTALWRDAVDKAADMGANAVIMADLGLVEYAATKHPDLRVHLSVQASASSAESILFYAREYGVKRVVLPRVMTIAQIAAINQAIAPTVETEAFIFGGLCVMAEGRCLLSSYSTGKSPNMNGVCSPASHVRYMREHDGKLITKIGNFTLNCVEYGEKTGYPTTCKGRYKIDGKPGYVFDSPSSLNAGDLLPQMLKCGVKAFKIEGRQRSRAYVEQVVSIFRKGVDDFLGGRNADFSMLCNLTEGQAQTTGSY